MKFNNKEVKRLGKERKDGIPLDQRERGGGLIRSNEPVVPPHPWEPERDIEEPFSTHPEDGGLRKGDLLNEAIQTGRCVVGPDGEIIYLSGGIV